MHSVQPTQKLLSYFDANTRKKGLEYVEQGRVLTCSQIGIKLKGEVHGRNANIYQSELTLSTSQSQVVSTSCSCPMYFDCKHTAALLMHHLNNESQPGDEHRATLQLVRSPDAKHYEISKRPKELDNAGTVSKNVQISLGRLSGLIQHNNEGPSRAQKATRNMLIYIIGATASIVPDIQVVNVSIRKDGTFGTSRFVDVRNFSEYTRPQYVMDEDLRIGELWEVLSPRYSYYGANDFMDPELFAVLLYRILDTGRARLHSVHGPVLSSGRQLPGRVRWNEINKDNYRLEIVAEKDDRSLSCLRWIYPWYIDSESMKCGPVSIPLPSTAIEAIDSVPAISSKEAAGISLLLAQLNLQDLIPPPPGQKPITVHYKKLERNIAIKAVRPPKALFDGQNFQGDTGGLLRTLAVSMHRDTASTTPGIDNDGNVFIEKQDSTDESEYIEQLNGLGFVEVPAEFIGWKKDFDRYFIASAEKWQSLSTRVPELKADGWRLSDETEKALVPTFIEDNDILGDIADSGSEWWFSLELNIDIDGKKSSLLPILTSAIRNLPEGETISEGIDSLNQDGRFVTFLPDGKLISLPFDRIKAMLLILQELLYGDSSQRVSISALHAAELVHLSNAAWTGVDRLRTLIEKLRKLTSIGPIEPPENFRAQLRPYQKEGLGWLDFLAEQKFGGILADDMGLGKTVQLLAHVCLEKEKGKLNTPFLVVCPTSVIPNWMSEAQKFAPHLKVVAYHGPGRAMRKRELGSADLVITTYPLIARDIKELSSTTWHGVALDESQAIKNPDTHLASTARNLKAGYRFCLSGTPIQNHLGELWSHFHFLMPGLLADQRTFTRTIRNPIEKRGNLELKDALANRIRPFVLRRTKEQVASELPDKVTITQSIELSKGQRDLYETIRLGVSEMVKNEVAAKGFKQSQIMILKALLRLRQVCCDPRLLKLNQATHAQGSAKLEQLIEMLQQLCEERRKILVFSQFTSMLDLIEDELDKLGLQYARISGETKDRKSPVEQFQNGDVPIFLISLKAGGTGLNLTAADVVIHYDPWWNPAVEDQATDRAHRIGQTKNVMVYKLIAQGTIEQRMIELQERKRLLANSIYGENGSNSSLSFSEEDLSMLLKPIGS